MLLWSRDKNLQVSETHKVLGNLRRSFQRPTMQQALSFFLFVALLALAAGKRAQQCSTAVSEEEAVNSTPSLCSRCFVFEFALPTILFNTKRFLDLVSI